MKSKASDKLGEISNINRRQRTTISNILKINLKTGRNKDPKSDRKMGKKHE